MQTFVVEVAETPQFLVVVFEASHPVDAEMAVCAGNLREVADVAGFPAVEVVPAVVVMAGNHVVVGFHPGK